MLSFLKILKLFDEPQYAWNVLGKSLETLKTFKYNSWIFRVSNIFLPQKNLIHNSMYILMYYIFFVLSGKREACFIGRKYIRAVTM